jgi:putative phosphoribosyl transferase
MFSDRIDAGRQLAERLSGHRGPATVVVGLPRGGVPVAAQVARRLGAPLDVILVRKLGVPFQPELGMGAIGEDGVRVINESIVRAAGVNDEEVSAVEAAERTELQRRADLYRRGRARIPLRGATVIVVDDGVATGSTAAAACQVARAEGATRVVLAVPVAPADWTERLAGAADEFVTVIAPVDFAGVGQFYRDFTQTSDRDVVVALDDARTGPLRRDVEIEVTGTTLAGELRVPPGATGVVVFAHGSGSSRHSPRNRHVADVLVAAGLGTLLFDLLETHEDHDRTKVFDIALLGGRLTEAVRAVRSDPDLRRLPVGLFGASTGAAAALHTAAEPDLGVAAVVSRGGRPDLAAPERLRAVRAPVRLIVGEHDEAVVDLNQAARRQLRCLNDLVVVPGATHLFEESGTLQAAAELARDWFLRHLVAPG